ncbi:uncharacterized protein EV422DRAFT_40431 [Fimicolochytrium jonesii]|uniref:uncharacterized protein n=1 Tax=Fimicolochytrium jonesii TaxID=1396493 RepID=UPI0022FE103C|nr:uncharacterized protein EV422DRAFT_40431 [Fimicolochytrium jonesii]KAI8821381.1 hypothetical protein EV422DRAFT_40431 [Fimicolochytrium jonesii]
MYDELTVRFLERLRTTEGSTHEVWDDYTKLMESTLDNVRWSTMAHHQLFRILDSTQTNAAADSKATVMSSIVRKLASSASSEEYERLIRLHDDRNNSSTVNALILEMRRKGMRPSIRAYNSLISVYVRNNQMAAALGVLDKLKTPESWDPTAEHPLKPDATTYTILIRGFLEKESHAEGERLFREMRALGFSPSVSIYNQMMMSSIRRKRNTAAIRLFQDMQQSLDIVPNLSSYRLCVAAHANNRNHEAARKMLNEMLNSNSAIVPRPDYAIWRVVIKAIVAADDVSGALQVFRHLQSLAPKRPTKGDVAHAAVVSPGADIYDSVIGLCCSHGDATTAQELYADMVERGIEPLPSTLNHILRMLAKLSKWEEVDNVFEDAATKTSSLVALDVIADLISAAIADKAYDTALTLARKSAIPRLASTPTDTPRGAADKVDEAICNLFEALAVTERMDDATDLVSRRRQIPFPVAATTLSQMYTALLRGAVATKQPWDSIQNLITTCAANGVSHTPAFSNDVLKAACQVHTKPTKPIIDLLDSNSITPSVPGWLAVLDILLDTNRSTELRLLHSELKWKTGESAKLGFCVLDIVLARLDGRRDTAEVGDGEVGEGWAARLWTGLREEEVEMIVAMVARRGVGTGG